jgi:hypothetical protein
MENSESDKIVFKERQQLGVGEWSEDLRWLALAAMQTRIYVEKLTMKVLRLLFLLNYLLTQKKQPMLPFISLESRKCY